MRRSLIAWALVWGLIACEPGGEVDLPIEPYDPLPLVDPMIGTGGVGGEVVGLNPGAALPFGMTQVGPDTRHSELGAPPFYHFGGYHHGDDRITGFSHEHANGMGVNDFGTILVMPRASWQDDYADEVGRAAPFSHEREDASPGYYAVTLDDDGTSVEIVATTHGAAHRLRFPDPGSPVVLLDLGHQLGTVDVDGADLTVDLEQGRVDAHQVLRGNYSTRFGGLQTWAHLSFEPAPVAAGVWADGLAPTPDQETASGDTAGTWLTFPPGTGEVLLKVALSHVDAAGAQSNHAAELEGRDFEDLRQAAEEAWRAQLGRVRVRGGTEDERVVFHTALYHAALWPNVFMDVDGRYRGMDGAIHEADFDYHSNFSMWDTFRTTHPWFALAQPDKARELARSLVRMYEDGGAMPRWALGHGYTGGMVGTPASQILAGTWLKGIEGWDAELAFEACFRHSTEPMPEAGRAGVEEYQELGYVPMEVSGGSASLGIEYSWNDHALALWAEALGLEEEAAQMDEAGGWWRNNWDPAQGYMVGRYADGSFRPVVDPDAWSNDYVEGNSWHYLWPAPYDVSGMVELQYGGDLEAFAAALDLYWARVHDEEDDVFPDTYYWHGNEPDLHHPWLGSLAGLPELSVEPVHHVMATRYGTGPDGLDGNDDAGTLSSWYLFASLGLYPVAGTPDYAVGSPIFERVEIDRPDGTLVVRARDLPSSSVVPSAVRLGDEDLSGWTLTHAALVGSGELLFSYE